MCRGSCRSRFRKPDTGSWGGSTTTSSRTRRSPSQRPSSEVSQRSRCLDASSASRCPICATTTMHFDGAVLRADEGCAGHRALPLDATAIPPWFTSGSLRSAAATHDPRTHVQAPPRPVSDARRHTEPHDEARCPAGTLQGRWRPGASAPARLLGTRSISRPPDAARRRAAAPPGLRAPPYGWSVESVNVSVLP
jgi:hypothetical protein